MRIKLVTIGNSRGVRLPRPILDQVELVEEAELSVEDGRIVLAPVPPTRAGWELAFASDPDGDDAGERDWTEADLAADDDWKW